MIIFYSNYAITTPCNYFLNSYLFKFLLQVREVKYHLQARSQAEAEEEAASSDLAQIDNVLIMCSHDITYHFNIWTLCHSLVKKTNL